MRIGSPSRAGSSPPRARSWSISLRVDHGDDAGAGDREAADEVEDPVVAEDLPQCAGQHGGDQVAGVVEAFIAADSPVQQPAPHQPERQRGDGGRDHRRGCAQQRLCHDHRPELREQDDQQAAQRDHQSGHRDQQPLRPRRRPPAARPGSGRSPRRSRMRPSPGRWRPGSQCWEPFRKIERYGPTPSRTSAISTLIKSNPRNERAEACFSIVLTTPSRCGPGQAVGRGCHYPAGRRDTPGRGIGRILIRPDADCPEYSVATSGRRVAFPGQATLTSCQKPNRPPTAAMLGRGDS